MTIASIDIGSNSILLLIAKIDFNNSVTTIKNFYRAPRISDGLLPGKIILPSKIDALITTLKDYIELCNQFKTDLILVVATAAFRNASNAQEIIELVKKETGLEIKIIDGETEGFLSFIGTDDTANKEKVVIDIGGASTEIIFRNSKKISFKKSFDIGAVSLNNLFINKFNRDLERAYNFLYHIFSPSLNNIPHKSYSIAVAGTPTTLSCIKQGLKTYEENLVDGSDLLLEEINKIIYEMIPLSPAQILEKYGKVVEGREDIILCGSVILKSIMGLIKTDSIKVSSRGLRYGVIYDYIKNQLKNIQRPE